MVDTLPAKPQTQNGDKVLHKKGTYSSSVKGRTKCCIHDSTSHSTGKCRQFLGMAVSERREALKAKGLCFRCFGEHRRSHCKEDSPCELCGRRTHHTLMHVTPPDNSSAATDLTSPDNSTNSSVVTDVTSNGNVKESRAIDHTNTRNATSCAAQGGQGLTLYGIYAVPVVSSRQKAVVFCDDGSDTSFISQAGVKRLKPKRLVKTTVELDTLTGTKQLDTYLYEVVLIQRHGRRVAVVAIGLPQLTGEVSQIDEETLSSIFPDLKVSQLQHPIGPVDLLIGQD